MLKSFELNHVPRIGINRGLNGINLDEREDLFKRVIVRFSIQHIRLSTSKLNKEKIDRAIPVIMKVIGDNILPAFR